MTAYVKFNPWASLKREGGDKSETLASLATLARSPREIEKSLGDEMPSPESSASWNQNQKHQVYPAKVAKVAKADAGSFPFAGTLAALERRCPDYIDPRRWHLCIDDAKHFLLAWGDQAEALGWTPRELFGLHTPPAKPHPSYHRLSRYDETGLIWHLTGNCVVALSADTAAIQSRTTGTALIYRKARKPALAV